MEGHTGKTNGRSDRRTEEKIPINACEEAGHVKRGLTQTKLRVPCILSICNSLRVPTLREMAEKWLTPGGKCFFGNWSQPLASDGILGFIGTTERSRSVPDGWLWGQKACCGLHVPTSLNLAPHQHRAPFPLCPGFLSPPSCAETPNGREEPKPCQQGGR